MAYIKFYCHLENSKYQNLPWLQNNSLMSHLFKVFLKIVDLDFKTVFDRVLILKIFKKFYVLKMYVYNFLKFALLSSVYLFHAILIILYNYSGGPIIFSGSFRFCETHRLIKLIFDKWKESRGSRTLDKTTINHAQ